MSFNTLNKSLHFSRGVQGSGQNLKRFISLAVNREVNPDKPKPFPYEEKEYKGLAALWDYKSSSRFDDNSKIVTVEGISHIGKTEFAKDLAKGLDMHYMEPLRMGALFDSPYKTGASLKDFNHLLPLKMKANYEIDVLADPEGKLEPGRMDRFMQRLLFLKFVNYQRALRHLFNTGQGVVLESSFYTHDAMIKAGLDANYIERGSSKLMQRLLRRNFTILLRPNLVINLDTSIEKMKSNMKNRGLKDELASHVFSDPTYFSSYKRNLDKRLDELTRYSQVLSYNNDDGVDMDIILNDIEGLNFDFYAPEDDQQRDWRMVTDIQVDEYRNRCSTWSHIQNDRTLAFKDNYYRAEHLFVGQSEMERWHEVIPFMKDLVFQQGYNTHMGDSNAHIFRLFKKSLYKSNESELLSCLYPWFYNSWQHVSLCQAGSSARAS